VFSSNGACTPGTLRRVSRAQLWDSKPAVVFGCPFGSTKLGGAQTRAPSPNLCVKIVTLK